MIQGTKTAKVLSDRNLWCVFASSVGLVLRLPDAATTAGVSATTYPFFRTFVTRGSQAFNAALQDNATSAGTSRETAAEGRARGSWTRLPTTPPARRASHLGAIAVLVEPTAEAPPPAPTPPQNARPTIVRTTPPNGTAIRTPPRTVLQQSAHRNRQVHAYRAYLRVFGLFVLDCVGIAAVIGALRIAPPLVQALGMQRWLHLEVWSSIAMVQTICALCTGLFLLGCYAGGDPRRDANRLASGSILGLLIMLWNPLWSDFTGVVGVALVSAVVFVSSVVLWRWAADRGRKWARPAEENPVPALLIGSRWETSLAKHSWAFNGEHAFLPVACVDPSIASGTEGHSSTNYGFDELPDVIAKHDIDTVVLCGQLDDTSLSRVVISAEAAGCRVMSYSRAYSLAKVTPSVRWQEGSPMIELTRPALHGRDLMLKRALDIVCASLVLLLASPIMAVVAILVRLTSAGPMIFQQVRVGYAGTTFTIYKFRTMYVDAESRLAALQGKSVYGDGKLFKMASDPRITPLGRWLRKTSLDELPQLFNVLFGDMSLVGPRPPLPREVERYEDEEFIRFGMKPGITGPWQVSGRNRITSFAQVLRIESAYFSGWTIWRDFRILARTIPAVLKMDGAH